MDLKLVTIMETQDQPLILIAKSILEDASIRCILKGEQSSNLFASSIGYNPIFGLMQLQVDIKDLDVARKLLQDLQ